MRRNLYLPWVHIGYHQAFRVFRTIPGRVVERGGKGWRIADAVHLCSHYPVGLREADTQILPMSIFVSVMSRMAPDFGNKGDVYTRFFHRL